MGGMISGAAPINEAVNLINSIEPAALDDLKIRLPTLDLRPGIVAGEPSDEETRAFLEDKARVIEKAADVAEGISKSASEKLKERIRVSNRTRLIIQIVTVLSSASVLGTLIADQSLLVH